MNSIELEYSLKDEWVTHALDWCRLWREVYIIETGLHIDISFVLGTYKQIFPDHYEHA